MHQLCTNSKKNYFSKISTNNSRIQIEPSNIIPSFTTWFIVPI